MQPMKYRKKPVVIEAVQWSENYVDICQFTGMNLEYIHHFETGDKDLIIPTLEGQHYASMGDYIIKGVKGEFYPCKPDIFELTYEAVN